MRLARRRGGASARESGWPQVPHKDEVIGSCGSVSAVEPPGRGSRGPPADGGSVGSLGCPRGERSRWAVDGRLLAGEVRLRPRPQEEPDFMGERQDRAAAGHEGEMSS